MSSSYKHADQNLSFANWDRSHALVAALVSLTCKSLLWYHWNKIELCLPKNAKYNKIYCRGIATDLWLTFNESDELVKTFWNPLDIDSLDISFDASGSGLVNTNLKATNLYFHVSSQKLTLRERSDETRQRYDSTGLKVTLLALVTQMDHIHFLQSKVLTTLSLNQVALRYVLEDRRLFSGAKLAFVLRMYSSGKETWQTRMNLKCAKFFFLMIFKEQ